MMFSCMCMSLSLIYDCSLNLLQYFLISDFIQIVGLKEKLSYKRVFCFRLIWTRWIKSINHDHPLYKHIMMSVFSSHTLRLSEIVCWWIYYCIHQITVLVFCFLKLKYRVSIFSLLAAQRPCIVLPRWLTRGIIMKSVKLSMCGLWVVFCILYVTRNIHSRIRLNWRF